MKNMEETMQLLSNIYENYLIDTKKSVTIGYKAKCLGAMEALLLVLGKLQPGVAIDYQVTNHNFKLFWFIPVNYTIKEEYDGFILRLAAETLGK